MLFSFTGCGSSLDAYIYFELPATPQTLDPQTASMDSELLIIRNIFEGLLRHNDKNEIIPAACESYSQDGLIYTFKLRKNLKWSDGKALTANDFGFSLTRAVLPETKAPFASRLFSIENAKAINEGSASSSALGVTVLDDYTLQITLEKEDPLFLETLTSSIAMPCREDFFNESDGKYGLFADNILSNGSYEITRWRKDPFGIRLYKNENYESVFEAKNAAVFLTCNDDETALEKLEKNSIDIAFIDCTEKTEAEALELKTASIENISWFLTINDDFPLDLRKSLALLIGDEVFQNSLPEGYSAYNCVLPKVLKSTCDFCGNHYDIETAKSIYKQVITTLEGKKFPTDVVLTYYDDGNIKNIVTDIVGHWQSNLSAFVNIKTAENPEDLIGELQNQNCKLAIFPLKASSIQSGEYLRYFGNEYITASSDTVCEEITGDYKILPIFSQSTVISYNASLSNVIIQSGDGYLDFSFIIKDE